MTRKLSELETLNLVQLYREHECLWNLRCDAYKNKQMRTSALQQIAEGMQIEGLTIAEVKAKLKSVRSTYYLEISKIEKSTRSGSGGNVYVPKVKWFYEFDAFIKNVAVRRPTMDNTQNNNDRSGSSTNQVRPPDSPRSENESQVTQPGTSCAQNEYQVAQPGTSCAQNEYQVTPQHTARSEYGSSAEKLTTPRSKRSKLSQMALMIKDLKHINDENIPITEETEHDIFGKSVSSQLKKLSEEQAIIAQEKIQSILTQCKLVDLKANKLHSASERFMQQFPNTQFSQWNPIRIEQYCNDSQFSLPDVGTTSPTSSYSHNDSNSQDSSDIIQLAFDSA